MAGTGIHPYHQQRPRPAALSICARIHAQSVHHHHNHNRRPYNYDELRTISIAGLPDDVRERELLNLLRLLPGYEASQLNFKGEKPMGDALFSTAQFAVAAKDKLQNLVFDAESKSVIHTEMAKKNLFVKRGIVGDSNTYDQSKRLRTGGDCTHSVYSPSCSLTHERPKRNMSMYRRELLFAQFARDAKASKGTLEPPEDKSIKTLFISGFNLRSIEQKVRDQFGACGEIESVGYFAEEGRAFFTYTSREGAEKAVQELSKGSKLLVINGCKLKLTWARLIPEYLIPRFEAAACRSGNDGASSFSSSYQMPPHQPDPPRP